MANKLKPQNTLRFTLQLGIIVLLTTIDLLIKYFVERDLRPISTANFIPDIIGLRYAQNTGAAFSSLSNMTGLLSLITGIMLFALLIFLYTEKNGNKFYHIFIPIIIGGGMGNLIDRLFRGYVVDYLEILFFDFAIFNFADCLVTCGATALICYLIFSLVKEAKLGKGKV